MLPIIPKFPDRTEYRDQHCPIDDHCNGDIVSHSNTDDRVMKYIADFFGRMHTYGDCYKPYAGDDVGLYGVIVETGDLVIVEHRLVWIHIPECIVERYSCTNHKQTAEDGLFHVFGSHRYRMFDIRLSSIIMTCKLRVKRRDDKKILLIFSLNRDISGGVSYNEVRRCAYDRDKTMFRSIGGTSI